MQTELVACKVTLENFEITAELQRKIFPYEGVSCDILASCNSLNFSKTHEEHFASLDYWIFYDKDRLVGFTSLCTFKINPNDVWISYFGVDPSVRRQNYGGQIFDWTVGRAKDLGFEHLRLYTTYEYEMGAVNFYRNKRMLEETYRKEPGLPYVAAIFSLNLQGNQIEEWGDKLIHLCEHDGLNKAFELDNHLIDIKPSLLE